jgi:hypothetical protein
MLALTLYHASGMYPRARQAVVENYLSAADNFLSIMTNMTNTLMG